MTLRRSLTPVLSILAALVLVVCGWLAASPAFAHDELISTDPSADATLEALPAQLTLSFSAELLDGGGNEVIVTDAAGAPLTDGAAVVDGTNLVQALVPEAAPGAITVIWRAVSSDGHPISGQYAFTVTAPVPSPTASDEPSTTPEPSMTASTPDETVTASPAPTSQDAVASPLPWILGVVALLLLAGLLVAVLVIRARRSDDVEGPGSGGSADR